jgi:hypothetical protein
MILNRAGEPPERITNLMEVRQTGISIERFRKVSRTAGFDITREVLFFVNPNYEVKFGLKPRRLPGMLSLPFFRNFLTTSVYVVLKKNNRR